MSTSFRRIAIVNRGEPAIRVINAVGELTADGADLTTIALVTDPDRRAMFVRRADETYHLGPATFLDEHGNRQVTYLDLARLEQALIDVEADAVWVGWGFVAERADFAELCERRGITFIGPSSAVMRRLGDKITSKQIAEASGVPVAAWSGGPVESLEHARSHAEHLGFPLLIKATAGGGGRGIRRVDSADQLGAALESARAEARNAFGDPTVFLETLVPRAKHIEVQIIGDATGTVWPVGVRDCTVQRRNQKLLEESPSPSLTPTQDAEIRAAAARLGAAAGYRNAGTVEFLFDAESEQFSFMEVNARLQVEHPVTEMTTGLDLVKLQLHVAAGGTLDGDPPASSGHAIEARLNAEDPESGFAPSPGRLQLLRLASGPGLRVDTGVEEGDDVAGEFDSMIAKIIAHGRDRGEALARLRRALRDTTVVIDGGASNKAFLQRLLEEQAFVDATVDVGWVDRGAGTGTGPGPHADVAIVAAAIDDHQEQMAAERAAFRASAVRGRPAVDTTFGRVVNLRHRGVPYRAEVFRLAPDAYRILLADRSVVVHWNALGVRSARLDIRGRSYRVVSSVHGVTHLVEVDGHPHRIVHDEGGVIRAPSPSVVVSIDVHPGDEVVAGDRLAVIEAMKMETVIAAEFAGRVEEIAVAQNAQVAGGAPLMVVRPVSQSAEGHGERVDFEAVAALGLYAHRDCRHYLDAVREALLGFDIDPSLLRTMANPGATPCPDVLPDDENRALEDELLGVFADVISLFRREPVEDDDVDELTRRATEEYLLDYLLHTESRGRGLPARFLRQLERALAHFGVTSLDPSPELDVALYRLVVSHHRMSRQIETMLQLSEHRLAHADAGGDEDLRGLLDRLVHETRARHPAVNDLARELRYRVFDAPFLAHVNDRLRADALRDIDTLVNHPAESERGELIDRLVACPLPLRTMLSDRFAPASAAVRGALLELMTRRYYRMRELSDVTVCDRDGLTCVTAEYEFDGRPIHLLSTHVDRDRLAEAVEAIRPELTDVSADRDIVVDVYVWAPGQVADPEVERAEITAVLSDRLGALALRRIVVSMSDPSVGAGTSSVRHLTLRPDGEGGYAEQMLYRDLHPMMGKRLELWRLAEFDAQRIPSTEDVYVFHGRARSNPRDERLFALAEVRDLTPITDDAGAIVRLPEAERVVHEVFGSIRHFQAHRPPTARLQSNRIILYVWPEVEFAVEDVAALIERLAADAAGLGVAQLDVLARFAGDGQPAERLMLEVTDPGVGRTLDLRVDTPPTDPIEPLQPHEQNVARLRQRGLTSPYEIIGLLTPDHEDRGIAPGSFVEYDFPDPDDADAAGDDTSRPLTPVDRPPGQNAANVVVGVIESRTERYPEGMRRVVLLGDPSRGMGNLAGPECSRISAAFDLAEELGVPLEWFAVSAGALIAMDSGTENMDWIARVLRRIIEFTQAGGEVNVVVTGINVGAQPYWNAEATMLMHTSGVLIMMPESAMVLTGKEALDFSGGVSADDNIGIGGYERIMGPNGQAQYLARDLPDAVRHLLQHYEYCYVAPGERFARSATTIDPPDRDVRSFPHGGQFETVGDVFDEATNPGRKQPFEIRKVMTAAVDRDRPTMERWFGMRDAEIPVVWDAFLGGRPIALIGFEAKSLPRAGYVPADGPETWTSGTLFPQGSRKVARAVNAASGNRPLVVLANLSGFDGSPESMRERQLEFGAEIGRAIVNFDGPIVFCVVSRYHGGAFVVFSGALNDNFEVAAIEGAHASVIGGAPAAAVVFAREVKSRVEADPAVREVADRIVTADPAARARLRNELDAVRERVRTEKLGEVASEFDRIHDIDRARRVGSVDTIIPASELRPYLIDAVERGIARHDARV